MEISEVAERVLFSTSLEEKLQSPRSVTDQIKESGISVTTLEKPPGRPPELMVSERGVKADFPGTENLENTAERGKMLHFLANHELLATELMALVLLKFPNAPEEFRQGVYQTMREEQAHTLMYMRRMKECSVEFGQLPVNDYFWRMVAPMECPLDFVSRLSLVFEQANLDYSLHYGKLFRQVGDTGTAAVLDKIYHDEIDHVGHGLKWFRKWKEQGLTDWQAFKKQLHFPLTVARAKGMAPFNAEARREVGIDEDWIKHLEVSEQSRGRTPIIHWFNPNAELAMAAPSNQNFTAKKQHILLEKDLAALPIAWARRDDVVLIDHSPSREHLIHLRNWGFPLPEFIELHNDGELTHRKIGGLKPWAWGPEASALLKKYASNIPAQVKLPWREAVPSELFSKQSGIQLAELLDESISSAYSTEEEVTEAIKQHLEQGDVLLKAPLSNAGRGHHRLAELNEKSLGWIRNILSKQGSVIVEPWHDRIIDFSAQYEVHHDHIKHVGMTRVLNDPEGRYLGTYVHTKWASGLNKELSKFLFNEKKVMTLYRDRMPEILSKLLPKNFRGNLSIDAMVYRENDTYKLRKVVEINPRMTMGRVALELMKKSAPGKAGLYQILRKSKLGDWQTYLDELPKSDSENLLQVGSYPLNDPSQAEEFIAIWHVRSKASELPLSDIIL